MLISIQRIRTIQKGAKNMKRIQTIQKGAKNMKMRKTLSTILAGMLVASTLTACFSKTVENSSTSDAEGKTANQEPYTVKILMLDEGKTDSVDLVAKAASEITKKKFNTDIKLERVGWGTWSQRVNLALTSGEKLDLFPAFALNSSLSSLVSTGQIIELDKLLESKGQETLKAISKGDLKCTTINGKIYGIPFNKGKQNVVGAAVDKAMADKLQIDYKNITDLKSLGDALAKVKAAYPDMYPLASSNGKMSVVLPTDGLGDSRDSILGGLENAFGDSTKVVNIYETEGYKNYVKTMYDWAKKGYIMPDASSNTESGNNLIKAGVSFANLYTGPAPDTEARLSREVGKPIVDSVLVKPYATTSETAPSWSIAANSEKPERAMEILNEMYTNKVLANIFINGIEGKHYEFIDKEKGIIDYPKGVNATNSGYNVTAWAWPNMQLSYVWNGYPSDVYDKYQVFNASGHPSPAYGFTFENTSVLNAVTACSNVVNKYVNALNTGSLDPDENLPKFNKELKDAGINTIIAEKQKQLDAWLAKQK
jgi:putative aldouronate transport system substrate-binding protein